MSSGNHDVNAKGENDVREEEMTYNSRIVGLITMQR